MGWSCFSLTDVWVRDMTLASRADATGRAVHPQWFLCSVVTRKSKALGKALAASWNWHEDHWKQNTNKWHIHLTLAIEYCSIIMLIYTCAVYSIIESVIIIKFSIRTLTPHHEIQIVAVRMYANLQIACTGGKWKELSRSLMFHKHIYTMCNV